MVRLGFVVVLIVAGATSASAELFAAVLPSTRSVQVGQAATAFATIINAGATAATNCRVATLMTELIMNNLAAFSYQATEPATNQPAGTPNTPVDIPAGRAQTFVFAFTPTAPFGLADVNLVFVCSNTPPARVVPGLNTFALASFATPAPDIVAIAVTPSNDGIVNIPASVGIGVFAVAVANVGASSKKSVPPGLIVVQAARDVGTAIDVSMCQTDAATGRCLAPPTGALEAVIEAGGTATFGVFVTATGPVPFDPARHRVFTLFSEEPIDDPDLAARLRGSTSVAVRTQ